MGFLFFGYDFRVFMGLVRCPLSNRLELAVRGTGKLAYQNRDCFINCGEL